MTGLSLRNPIAVLMICIALVVFAGVVTPRMSVDTFPELTPPVLVIGTLAPGLGPKDVEKTLTWRLEKYVSATPGVDHVESVSRNNLSIIYVWLKWGTDLNAAQTLVQQQAAFAMAAVPKSLGVLPPFVLQYDPSNAPVVQVVVTRRRATPGRSSTTTRSTTSSRCSRASPASPAPRRTAAGMRQINVVVDPSKAQARNVTVERHRRGGRASRTRSCLRASSSRRSSTRTSTPTRSPPQVEHDRRGARSRSSDGKPVLIRDVARVEDGGTPPTQSVSVNGKDAVYLNVLRIPGGNTIEIVDAVKNVVGGLEGPAARRGGEGVLRPVDVRAHDLPRPQEGDHPGARPHRRSSSCVFLQSVRGTLIVSVAIPLSFAITLIVLYASGQTLNAFTLGGLTLAMGRLVDDAVVVLESIHRHQRMGMSTPERRAARARTPSRCPCSRRRSRRWRCSCRCCSSPGSRRSSSRRSRSRSRSR